MPNWAGMPCPEPSSPLGLARTTVHSPCTPLPRAPLKHTHSASRGHAHLTTSSFPIPRLAVVWSFLSLPSFLTTNQPTNPVKTLCLVLWLQPAALLYSHSLPRLKTRPLQPSCSFLLVPRFSTSLSFL
ncbi:hypothetical protein LX32DRAFT_302665 [Colletotrichum zoysiae]|uniref:Uncharacterized protein n=1 Tax=Colletotrichum zoysiae TaxID=1216348 RepID=A0AAD9HMS9_9PEZI|nr:hypothetical protein LX32DRAFT_302665 [Colletotrichum zoysiae]